MNLFKSKTLKAMGVVVGILLSGKAIAMNEKQNRVIVAIEDYGRNKIEEFTNFCNVKIGKASLKKIEPLREQHQSTICAINTITQSARTLMSSVESDTAFLAMMEMSEKAIKSLIEVGMQKILDIFK